MTLVLEGNYSKKIGLACYSSHQFSLTLKTEITDIAQVPAEAARLYRLLQDGVDTSIKEIGSLPGPSNGTSNGHTMPPPPPPSTPGRAAFTPLHHSQVAAHSHPPGAAHVEAA